MDMRKRSGRILKNAIPKKISSDIEKAIFNYTILTCKNFDENASYANPFFSKIYLLKLKEFLINIEDVNFKEELLKSKKPHEIIFKNEFENFSDKFKKYDNDNNVNEDNNNPVFTEMFICPKCQSNKCSYYEMQTRSSDEAMTSFITCSACGNKWKE